MTLELGWGSYRVSLELCATKYRVLQAVLGNFRRMELGSLPIAQSGGTQAPK